MPSRIVVAKELADIFKVLSHPDRLRIIEELRAGQMDVNTLHMSLGLPATRVSQHLSLLRAHRLVTDSRDGRHVYYALTQPDLAAWVVDGLRFIESRMASDSQGRRALRKARELWSTENPASKPNDK
ncbi:MAG: metalloregulator ArsR/SmtB family transcription factor [Pseudomonadota bacterium]